MILRKYQENLISEVLTAVKSKKDRILLMAPTGSGKTVIAMALLKIWLSKGKRCLFTCHRKNLVNQTYKRFASLNPSVMMGRDVRFNADSQLQIGSIYTIKNREFASPDFILMDEVHYGYKTELIQGIMERFPKAIIIGLSATPIDERAFLLEGFNYYIDQVQTKDLIDMKWLVPPRYYCPVELDLSHVGVNSYGDYVISELEGVVIQERLLQTAIDNYIKHGEDRPFIAFAVSKKHGMIVTELFNKAGIPVGYLDSDTRDEDRKNMDEQFVDGVIRGIVSIDILTTGADYPHCSCVVDMAPTVVLRKYIQKGGRPARLYGDSFDESLFNGKIDFIYLDLAGAVKEHGLLEDRRIFKFKPKISKVIDRDLGINLVENSELRNSLSKTVDKERFVYLQKIGRALDIFDGKVYNREDSLMDDIRSFLKKTDLFWYRQNSGVAQYGYALDGELRKFLSNNPATKGSDVEAIRRFIGSVKSAGDRFVRFTSVSGLADMSLFFRIGSVFFGIEAKLKTGRLTPNQKQTFPQMIEAGVLLFFAMSVYHVYEIICHVENNVLKQDNGDIIIKSGIYELPDSQKDMYEKFGLSLPILSKCPQQTSDTFSHQTSP